MEKGINLRLGVELSGEETFKAGLKQIDEGLKNVKAAQAGLGAEFDKGDKSLSRYTKQQELLEKKLTLQKQKLDAIRKEHEKVAAAQGADSAAAQKLAREYEYQSAACGKTQRELDALGREMEQATSRTAKFRAELEKGDSTLTKIGKSVSDVGKKLTASLTLPIAAAAGVCVKSFMDFEDEMAVVSTVADTAAISLDELSAQALETSNAAKTSATEIAKGAYAAISAGVDTAESMQFMEKAAKAAKAGQSDISTVVNGSTSAMNAWGIASKDATGVFERMIVAQNLGKTTLGEIASQIGNVTGIAPALNVSLDEILASVAALTKNGVKTSSAFTGLKAVMSGILKPTAEAAETARRLGIDFSAAGLKSKGLTKFLAEVQEKTGGSEAELAKLFGSVEGLSQVMLLGGAAAQDYAATLEAMGQSAGALETAFEQRTSSRAEQLSASLNKLNNEAIKLGQSAAPLVDIASNAIGKLADILNSMTPAQQQTMLTIAAVLAAVGPLTMGIGKAAQSVGSLSKAFKALSKLVGGTGPLALALISITAIIAGVTALKKRMDALSGEYQIKAAFAGVTVDTSKIDEAIAEAEAIERQMQIEADAQLQFKQTGADIQARVLEMLSGSLDAEKIDKSVGDTLKPIFAAVDSIYEQKKRALDDALANGTITQLEYDVMLKKAADEASELTDNLASAEANYTALLKQIAESGEAATPEQLEALKRLREEIAALSLEVTTAQAVLATGSLDTYIKQWLTNGKAKTDAEISEINKLIDDTFKPFFDEIQANFETRKKDLDALLAAGVIDHETYTRELDKLTGDTNAATANIQKEKDAYSEYITSVATSTATATAAQIEMAGELSGAILAEYEKFKGLDIQKQMDALKDWEKSILPAPLDEATIERKVKEFTEPIRDRILAKYGITAAQFMAAVSLTEAEKAAIRERALLDSNEVKAALKLYGIDEATAEDTANSIIDAREKIDAAIKALKLSPDATAAIASIAATGGDIQAALIACGVDAVMAAEIASSINAAKLTIQQAIEALEISPSAKEAITNVAATGGDIEAALIGHGVSEDDAARVAKTITNANAIINDAVKSLGLSSAAAEAIASIAATGGDVEAAIIACGADTDTAARAAQTIADANAAINAALEALGLTPTAISAINALGGTGGSVEAALLAAGVDPERAAAVTATISAANKTIDDAIKALKISPEAASAIKLVATTGGEVEAALLAAGVDPAKASAIAAEINAANLAVDDAIKTLGFTPEAEQAVKDLASAGGSVEAALLAAGVDTAQASAAATAIKTARDEINAALEELGLSDKAQNSILSVLQSGGDVQDAIEKCWVDTDVAEATAKSISESWAKITAALDGIETDADLSGISARAQAEMEALNAAADAYRNFAGEIAAKGSATEDDIKRLKALEAAMLALSGAYASALTQSELEAALANGESMFAGIKEWLTDGWIDKPIEQEAAKAKVDEWLAPIVAGIEESYAEQKKALDDLLASGFIDTEAYDAELRTLTNKTNETIGALAAQKNAFTDYMITLAKASKNPTSEQIAQLESFKNAITKTVVDIANLDFSGTSLTDYIIEGLSKGNAQISPEELAEITEAIDGWLDPVFKAIEDGYNAKKKSLAGKLERGEISGSEYVEGIKSLKSEADATKAALIAEKDAYIKLVETISAQSGGATAAQIEMLEKMRVKILQIGNELLEANATATQAARARYELVSMGSKAATDADISVAVKYVQSNQAAQKASAKQLHDQEMAILQNEFDKAETPEIRATIRLKMEAQTENYNEQIDAIESAYTDAARGLFEGLTARFPEAASAFSVILDQQKKIADIDKLTAHYQKTLNAAKSGAEQLKAFEGYAFVFKQLTGKDAYTQMQVEDYVNDLKSQIATNIEALDKPELQAAFRALSNMISSGILDGIDLSEAGDVVKSWLTAFDFSDDGKSAGEALITGEIEGIAKSQEDLNAAIIASCEAANQALRDKQGIKSPSTVWAGFGGQLMAGLTGGINTGAAFVAGAINNLARKLYAAGRDTIQGLINGANSKRAALVAAYASIAGAAAGAAQTRLKIASPSRVFFEIGENTAEGMVRGVMAKTAYVKRAMTQMVSPDNINTGAGTQVGASAQASAGAQGARPVVINVTYSGAVTGRESRKLAQQLGGYLTQRQAAIGG